MFSLFSSAAFLLGLSAFSAVAALPNCVPDSSARAPYTPPPSNPFEFPPNVTMLPPYSTCNWVPAFPYSPTTQCPPGNMSNVVPLVPLFLHPVLLATAGVAELIIKEEVQNSSPYINSLQNLLQLHLSLNYFGCYTDAESRTIQNVLRDYKWNSFRVNFNNVSCDVDSQQAYILAEADDKAQDRLMQLARGIEAAVSAAGVVVKQPRAERFHMTLANVGYGYPSDCMVSRLQQQLLPVLFDRTFGQVTVCCFIIQNADGSSSSYFAQDCLDTGICLY